MRKDSCWKRIPRFLTKCSYPEQNDDWREGRHNERNGKKIKAISCELLAVSCELQANYSFAI